MRINSTNLKQFEGGDVVKQGDTASLFGYELLDENYSPVPEIEGQEATITLANRNGKTSLTSTVTDHKVKFTLVKSYQSVSIKWKSLAVIMYFHQISPQLSR